MISSAPEPDAPTVTVACSLVSALINTALAAVPDASAVSSQVPDLAIAPAEGEPNAGLGSVMVANTASAAVRISSVPALNNAPKAAASSLRVLVLYCMAFFLGKIAGCTGWGEDREKGGELKD